MVIAAYIGCVLLFGVLPSVYGLYLAAMLTSRLFIEVFGRSESQNKAPGNQSKG